MTAWTKIPLPLWPFLSIMCGLIAFMLITGGHILWPQNVGWLMDGDPATHLLGWEFFRHSPFWQWPIGANPDYGMEIGSSVVFTDSIPLMAFIFKPLSFLLPETFQYIGIWIALCFSLQAYFAWKLLSLLTEHKLLSLVGSLFFIVAPIGLFRLGVHYALFGQWVIIAALYYYCDGPSLARRWGILLIVTSLIHAYLLAMVLAIWLMDIVQRRWLKQRTTARSLVHIISGFALVALVMWAAGYFMLKSGVQSTGFGFYRMNLLAFIDTDNVWSRMLPDQPGLGGDYEGASYLGTGMLGLAVVALGTLLTKIKTPWGLRALPLVILSVLLFIFALSDHIAIGSSEAFQYALPTFTRPLTDTFRVSGRFIWPAYYALYLGIFYLIFKRLKPQHALIACAAMFVVQTVDMSKAWPNLREVLSRAPAPGSLLESPVWKDLGAHYKKIIYVLPTNSAPQWRPLTELAAAHQMAINIGYFARVNPDIEKAAREALIASVSANEFQKDALYVFENDFLWTLAANRLAPSNVAGVLDGYRILAPGLNDCKTCVPTTASRIVAEKNSTYDYASGPVRFAPGEKGLAYLVYGWGTAENWGTWSSGNSALIRTNLPPASMDRDHTLLIEGNAFLSAKHPVQNVEVLVNRHLLATMKFELNVASGTQSISIPKQLIKDAGAQLSILLKFKDAISPADAGASSDARKLALGIKTLEIRPD